ncbi:hypothetical protein DYB37_010610 [Aphanomyces astaci]|uniref:Uncharacterized protein n=1 Tax=Aphanomyces astaci TaxID=112090 RepID=A0A3R6XEI0_APHAT|nr:hypothetical protein DYB35_000453 [Aphanomyces astaci]RHZ11798.1 hypothetical protein DYB37_010610 [Aphanomyces astaci]
MSDPHACKYAYKPCKNLRVAKKDGDLHRLCEFHRDKANAVQKIYATRRRRERRFERRQVLMQKLLGTIEPVPFETAQGQQVGQQKANTDQRDLLEAELAGLLDDEEQDKVGDDGDDVDGGENHSSSSSAEEEDVEDHEARLLRRLQTQSKQ